MGGLTTVCTCFGCHTIDIVQEDEGLETRITLCSDVIWAMLIMAMPPISNAHVMDDTYNVYNILVRYWLGGFYVIQKTKGSM